jgi:Domain of unknown function (DUF4160)
MPTVLRWEGFRFYFYSHEPNEPPHIHVDGGGASAKFWLRPLALARNHGFAARELRVIRDKIAIEQGRFEEAWDEYFGR